MDNHDDDDDMKTKKRKNKHKSIDDNLKFWKITLLESISMMMIQ